MQFDIELIQEVYASYAEKVEKSRQLLGRPMTLTEKILYAHLYNNEYPHKPFIRGIDYVNFSGQSCDARCYGTNGFITIYDCRER